MKNFQFFPYPTVLITIFLNESDRKKLYSQYRSTLHSAVKISLGDGILRVQKH